MRQHSRNVACDDREANGVVGTIREGSGREIDGVADGSGFEEGADGGGGHGGGGVFGFGGGGAEVGEEDGVGVVPEEVVGEIANVPDVRVLFCLEKLVFFCFDFQLILFHWVERFARMIFTTWFETSGDCETTMRIF